MAGEQLRPGGPRSGSEAEQVDAASLSFIRVLAGQHLHRWPAVRRAPESTTQASNTLNDVFRESPFDQIAAGDHAQVIGILTTWLTWLDGLFQQGAAPSAWIPERMEYALSVSAKTTSSEVVTAPEYLDGRSTAPPFTTSSGNGLGATDNCSRLSARRRSSPRRFHFAACPPQGCGNSSDGAVNFCEHPGCTARLGLRLLLVKFALEYSNDCSRCRWNFPVGTRLTTVHSSDQYVRRTVPHFPHDRGGWPHVGLAHVQPDERYPEVVLPPASVGPDAGKPALGRPVVTKG
ncbi:MAG: hypothetical protein MRJ92_10925 [Nitrospira sp.]|nr:hypothetical protein [Nitrospira sp.]